LQGALHPVQHVEVVAAVRARLEVQLDLDDPVRARQFAIEVDLDFTAYATMSEMTHQPRNPPGNDPVPPHAAEFDPASPGSDDVVPSAGKRAPAADRAFERYVLPELDVLLRVAMSLTRNSADAEDLVQDTLLRAYGAVERFDGRYPRAWLLTIMRNAQVNRVRRRRPELLRDPEAGDRLLESQTPHDSAEQNALRDAFDATVEEALDSLPDKFKRVVRLVDLDGLSYQEAADALGVPIGTVMSRLHRARQRIKSRLSEDGLLDRSPQ
jgi:RNA polymerase sigma-70 factor, ECF subfamily